MIRPNQQNDSEISQTNLARRECIHAVVTQSAQMRELIDDVVRASQSSASIVLVGESGTGKELFSRIIHEHSERTGKYVKVNCAALPAELIESELFGHEKGAFTDAAQQRIGRFEFARGGTLLLDEVTEVPLSTQAKLLRALEEREIQRVGSNETISTDIRVIATSNRNIEEEVEAGRFRLDLFHRLNVISFQIPALRDRHVDIPLLVTHFMSQFQNESSQNLRGLTKSAMKTLVTHDWPGNIRELRNTVHRACVLTKRPLIDEDCFRLPLRKSLEKADNVIPDDLLGLPLAEIEKMVIMQSLQRYGNKKLTADKLGVTPRTLSNKLKLYSESPPAIRAA